MIKTISALIIFMIILTLSEMFGESETDKIVRMQTEIRITQYDIDRDNSIKKAKEKIQTIQDCIMGNVNNIGQDKEATDCVIEEKIGTATGTTIPVPERRTEEIKTKVFVPLIPNQLFYTTQVSDKCSISQTEKQHFKSNGRLATDVACPFGRAVLFAPDYQNKVITYTLERKNYPDTGDSLILHFTQKDSMGNNVPYFWLIGHIDVSEKLINGASIKTGYSIGQMNLSGVSSGYHSHIELWQGNNLKDGQKVSYSSSTRALSNMRDKEFPKRSLGETYYFTHYDLGSVEQNDSSPCIGASGKNLCDAEKSGIRTMAVTKDVREFLGIKWGDSVMLSGDVGCAGVFKVEDEMSARFKYGDVLRNGFPIKGDIPSQSGGACTIRKL